MGGATTPTRFRREDFHRTKHDSAFSKWQILIGSSDWEDYEGGKEGAERYRVGNLPPVCAPGLYEIGVAVARTDSGREVGKLEPDRVVVVYLGQADNVRSRLQHYGRSGSHLIYHRCSGESNGDGYRTGWLFKEIFSRGYPIVYRWAPMKSKVEAEQMEAKLLEKFDYGWNKLSNGARRPHDVLNKIEKISLKTNDASRIMKLWQALIDKKVGIPIKPQKPTLSNKKPNPITHEESFNFFDRVLKYGRSQPRLVTANPNMSVKEYNHVSICGVDLGDGSKCKKPPVEGRKRCVEHKGMRLTKNLITIPYQASCQEKSVGDQKLTPICGVIQNGGSPCEILPCPGRKRCEKHKGMRVNNRIVPKDPDSTSVIDVAISHLELGNYCGVELGDGQCCKRQPVKGRKRCEEHKGLRVNALAKTKTDIYTVKLSSVSSA